MKFMTAKELYEECPEKVDWVAKPWLATEAITELDGKAKSAGKTTFALAMCQAILRGEAFLGEVASKTSIVYLTEESRPSFRAALDRAGIGPADNFHILQWKELFGFNKTEDSESPWTIAICEAVNLAKRHGAKVLIVDTFAQFAKLTGDKENSAGDVLEAMEPLQVARDEGLAVLLIRHERKEGGSVGVSGRGSSALSGAVDIILQLQKPEGNHPTRFRQIRAVGRFDDLPGELSIQLTEAGSYEIAGSTSAIALEGAMAKLQSLLPGSCDGALTTAELETQTGIPRTTLQQAIDALEGSGFIKRSGAGRKGSPFRFHLVSAETPSTTPEALGRMINGVSMSS